MTFWPSRDVKQILSCEPASNYIEWKRKRSFWEDFQWKHTLLRHWTIWAVSTIGSPSKPTEWKIKSRNNFSIYRSPVSDQAWFIECLNKKQNLLLYDPHIVSLTLAVRVMYQVYILNEIADRNRVPTMEIKTFLLKEVFSSYFS